MRQLYLRVHLPEGGGELEIVGGDYHHMARVLRLRVGDRIDAVDASGRRAEALIVRLGRESLTLEARPAEQTASSGVRLELYQCLPKGQRMDLIVRQATEAGVSRIVVLRSARSEAEPTPARVERWRRICTEALEQCGRRDLPAIEVGDEIATLAQEGAAAGQALLCLFFHEEAGGEPLHRILQSSPPVVRLLVGPEGGLRGDEVRLLRSAGWRQAYLGSNVLRVETAATAAIAAVSVLLLEREAWKAVP